MYWRNVNGTRVVVIAFAILCGLTGIIAGIFEVLQGNIVPDGFTISTIGPKYSMADDFTYFAITIIPNFLLTGTLAIFFSYLFIFWSVKCLDGKYGVLVLLGLAIVQLLMGGGWVIDLALITCLLATLINKPTNWLSSRIPSKIQIEMVRLFPFSLVAYSLISLGMLGLTILGVNSEALIQFIELLAALMFIPIIVLIFGGLAQNYQRHQVLISQ